MSTRTRSPEEKKARKNGKEGFEALVGGSAVG